MAIIHATSDNFEKEVLQSKQPVLVDFWAVWCGPCQMMAPVLEDLDAGASDFKVAKVNVDENMELAATYQISSIPALMIFKDGQVVKQFIGVTDKQRLLDALHSL